MTGTYVLLTTLPACFRAAFACFPIFVVWCSVSTFYSASTASALCCLSVFYQILPYEAEVMGVVIEICIKYPKDPA